MLPTPSFCPVSSPLLHQDLKKAEEELLRAQKEAEARVACLVIRVLANFPKSSALFHQALKRKEAEDLLRKQKEAEARVADSKVILSGFLAIASAGFKESSRGALACTEGSRGPCCRLEGFVRFPNHCFSRI